MQQADNNTCIGLTNSAYFANTIFYLSSLVIEYVIYDSEFYSHEHHNTYGQIKWYVYAVHK